MGMFDSLRKKLKGITEEAEDAFEVVDEEPVEAEEAAEAIHVDEERGEAEALAEAQEAAEFDRALEDVTSEAGPTPSPEAGEDLAEGVEYEEHAPAAGTPTPEEPLQRPPGAEARAPEPEGQAAPAATSAAPAGGRAINPDKVEDLLWDLELALLESDVAISVVEEIKADLQSRLGEMRVSSAQEIPRRVEDALRDAMLNVLSMESIDFDMWLLEQDKPAVIMFVGVNGTGKTTAIGRIGHRLKEDGYSSVLAAGDTFRAGAIEQLERHGQNLGLRVVKHTAGSDPAAVAYDAIEHAKARKKDVVLLDTAGRMQTNSNLMDEMKKIQRVAKPDMIVFVGDSLAGNDAVEQAQKFNEAVGIDAVILTKVDTDAKGGAALSIAHAVGKPILFLGVGQEYRDLIPYDPIWMVDRIFEPAEEAVA